VQHVRADRSHTRISTRQHPPSSGQAARPLGRDDAHVYVVALLESSDQRQRIHGRTTQAAFQQSHVHRDAKPPASLAQGRLIL